MESKYDPRCSITDIEGSLNLRDLGGMPISGGRIFPYKRFLRSGSLSECSPDILDKLKEYGVTTVIDLRSKAEVAHYGNPAIGCDDIDFYNIPLFLGDPDSETDSTMEFLKTHHLGDFYIQVLEGLGSSVVDVLNTLSRAPGCSLFHCAHGKDRTGIICAIIYMLAGAEREDIIRNYEFSYEYISWFLDPLIENREECLKHTLRSDRINMEIMLDYLDEKYNGDICSYLRANGMTDEDINILRASFF